MKKYLDVLSIIINISLRIVESKPQNHNIETESLIKCRSNDFTQN